MFRPRTFRSLSLLPRLGDTVVAQWGAGGNNSKAKPKTVWKLLAEQAMSLGYLNGTRLKRRK